MEWARNAVALGVCIALGSCAPAGQGGPPVSDGGYGAPVGQPDSGYSAPTSPPAGSSPIATGSEIQGYLYDGSVEVAWYDDGQALYQVECGFVDAGGRYEADAFETEPDGYYSYDWWVAADGAWYVNGSQLCANITYYDEVTGEQWPTSQCYTAEWSTEDSLLLIDGRDQIAAEIFAWDGREHYQAGCDM